MRSSFRPGRCSGKADAMVGVFTNHSQYGTRCRSYRFPVITRRFVRCLIRKMVGENTNHGANYVHLLA
jgi:hypothetical protein